MKRSSGQREHPDGWHENNSHLSVRHIHTHKQVYKHTQTHLQVFLLPALRARRSKQTGDYYPHMYFLLNIQWHTYTSAILGYALIFVVSSQFVFWFLNYITVVSAMVIISHIKGILHIFNGICYTLLLLLKVVVVTYSLSLRWLHCVPIG